MIEELFFLRHGARLDQQDFQWRSTAAAPYDTPLSQKGFHQARKTGAQIAKRSKYNRQPERGDRQWVIHTSPFLRCVQTSLAVAQGLLEYEADADGEATPSLSDGVTQSIRKNRSIKLRIDCGLGEWLTPDYYQDIQPPPPMPELVHSALYYLRQVLARDVNRPAGIDELERDQATARFVDIDWEYDTQRLGSGGEYGEEWPEMHDRFRRSLRKLLLDGDVDPRQDSAAADVTGCTAILVTHGAGCNALIGAVSGRPVLQDVGLCALSHAVLRPTAAVPASPVQGAAVKVSDRYDLILAGDTDHLSSRPTSSVNTPNPNSFSRSNSRRSLHSLVAVGHDRQSDRGPSSAVDVNSAASMGSERVSGSNTAESTAPNSPDGGLSSSQGFASWNLHRTHSLARERDRKPGLWQRPASTDSLRNRSASVM